MRPHIAYLPINSLEVLGRTDQIIQQVPDLLLIEVLGNRSTILDLLGEQIREVLIVNLHRVGSYLSTAGIAAPSLGLVLMPNRQHEAVLALKAVDGLTDVCFPDLHLSLIRHIDCYLKKVGTWDVLVAFEPFMWDLEFLLEVALALRFGGIVAHLMYLKLLFKNIVR